MITRAALLNGVPEEREPKSRAVYDTNLAYLEGHNFSATANKDNGMKGDGLFLSLTMKSESE